MVFLTDRPACRLASHTALLPTNSANSHIACRCYGYIVICEHWMEIQSWCVFTHSLCSTEHSKVCFQPLQMNWAASNLMFAGTWQGMFWVNSKRFGSLPKTLPHSANFSLRSREVIRDITNCVIHFKLKLTRLSNVQKLPNGRTLLTMRELKSRSNVLVHLIERLTRIDIAYHRV